MIFLELCESGKTSQYLYSATEKESKFREAQITFLFLSSNLDLNLSHLLFTVRRK